MKIAVDISQIAYQGSGVARYTQHLVDTLLLYGGNNEFVFFFSSLRNSLAPKMKKSILASNVLKEYFFPPTFLNFLWNSLHIVPIERLTGNIDVYLSSDWVQAPAD